MDTTLVCNKHFEQHGNRIMWKGEGDSEIVASEEFSLRDDI